jgi:hypothetical protein
MARRAYPRHDIHGRLETYRCDFCAKWHIGNWLGQKSDKRRPRPNIEEALS